MKLIENARSYLESNLGPEVKQVSALPTETTLAGCGKLKIIFIILSLKLVQPLVLTMCLT